MAWRDEYMIQVQQNCKYCGSMTPDPRGFCSRVCEDAWDHAVLASDSPFANSSDNVVQDEYPAWDELKMMGVRTLNASGRNPRNRRASVMQKMQTLTNSRKERNEYYKQAGKVNAST